MLGSDQSSHPIGPSPLSPSQANALMPPAKRAKKATRAKSTTARKTATTAAEKRILLVDDDAEIIESMRTVLEAKGYQVLIARDGSQGVALAERELPEEYLFDVVFDPNEAANVAGDPANAGALADMRARLERWMKATDDPLLAGPIQAPSGAVFNDPDGLSPNEPTITAP